MADKARERTDRELKKMERRISEIYQKSAKDLYKKMDAYLERASKRIETHENALREALKTGDKDLIAEAKESLRNAKSNAYLRGRYYKDMISATTSELARANETALEYINGKMPDIYTWNYNQAQETAQAVGVRFNLINRDTVGTLMQKGEDHMDELYKHLKHEKDVRWNTKQITSSLLQGIIQGESIRDMAKRIVHITDRNRAAAIRNARTMVTGAENRGRNDSYKQLEERGVVLNKVWMATPDGRTRDWHLDMDGQEVGLDEVFIDGLGNELEYPGDPGGSPETVYNCRCTMVTNVIGFRNSDGTISEV